MAQRRNVGMVYLLTHLIEQGYRKKSWHGPNLKGAIRRVTAAQAAWRPGTGRKCIWEITLHTAYWKYAVRRRLLGEKRGSFALKGSNWFPLPVERIERSWRAAMALLDAEHAALLQAVSMQSEKSLASRTAGSSTTNIDVITGIAFHDIYHAGPIQTLKRLCGGG